MVVLTLSLAAAAGSPATPSVSAARFVTAPATGPAAIASRGAQEAPAPVYTPPEQSRPLGAEAPVRPLLQAVREAATALGEREWPSTTTQEIGVGTFERFDTRIFQRERVERVTGSFREGYSQTYIQIPEAIFVTAVEMSDEAAASEYYRLEMEQVQMTLDVQNQREDARAEVTYEDELAIEGVDEGFEMRYEVALEESPPSRFRVLFGRSGRHAMVVTFLQSDVDTTTAHALMRLLASRLRTL